MKNGVTALTVEELRQVYTSLSECVPDIEDFSWGPTYEFAMQRRERALQILKDAIVKAEIQS